MATSPAPRPRSCSPGPARTAASLCAPASPSPGPTRSACCEYRAAPLPSPGLPLPGHGGADAPLRGETSSGPSWRPGAQPGARRRDGVPVAWHGAAWLACCPGLSGAQARPMVDQLALEFRFGSSGTLQSRPEAWAHSAAAQEPCCRASSRFQGQERGGDELGCRDRAFQAEMGVHQKSSSASKDPTRRAQVPRDAVHRDTERRELCREAYASCSPTGVRSHRTFRKSNELIQVKSLEECLVS